MATSVLNTQTNLGEDHGNKYHQKQPIQRSSGKREPKVKKNKQPQRGMGVEKLEQLRIAEGWKKITEIPTTNHNPYFNVSNFSGMYPLLNGAPNVSVGRMGLNPNHYLGNFNGKFEMDLFGSSSVSTVTELSSTPKSLNCCSKKKRFNGENVGPFLGLNIEDNKNVFKGSKVKPPLIYQVGYAAVRPYYPGVEVLAVHKKEEMNVVMEYEFFPGGRKDFHNDHEFETVKTMDDLEASGSCVTIDASSSIDLSLKLSY